MSLLLYSGVLLKPVPPTRPSQPSAFMLMDVPAQTTEQAAGASDEASLAMKTLNPVADLISLPFQYNVDYNIGAKNATRQVLNIQPVIPVSLNEDWNVISRTILPIVDIGSVAAGVDSMSGLGDTTQSFFFSPEKPTDGWTWGAGPAFLLPTGTDGLSGRKWGAGPTAVALRQEHGWTYGARQPHLVLRRKR